MAKNPLIHKMANMPRVVPDGISHQDRLMSQMSLEQIREFRQKAMRSAVSAGLVSKSHNKAQNELAASIHAGERLTAKGLQKLIKQAKSQAGIDAGELIAFTLGNSKANKGLTSAINQGVMTPDVLNYYLANIKVASKQFSGGISPLQVVQNSRAVDIKRANEQIFMATVFKRQGNTLYFLTNAGPNSKDINHKVVVELSDYGTFLIGRKKMPSRAELVQFLRNGKIKFDCDCGRHQYWYRYLATVGRYNHGVSENRYPTTRNPQLTGVACKHTLRVMNFLMSGYGLSKLQAYIKADLAKVKGHGLISQKSERTSLATIKQEARLQSGNRQAEHIRRKIKQQLNTFAKAIKNAKNNNSAGKNDRYNQEIRQAIATLQKAGVKLSDEQLAILNANKAGNKGKK